MVTLASYCRFVVCPKATIPPRGVPFEDRKPAETFGRWHSDRWPHRSGGHRRIVFDQPDRDLVLRPASHRAKHHDQPVCRARRSWCQHHEPADGQGAAAADNGYELVGIPDGIGTQWDNGKIVAYVNHELRNNVGIARRHGVKGAFQPASADQLDILAWLPGPDLLRQ
jgi:hypothetical protein